MKKQISSILILFLIFSFLQCSVDYSLLENRYCNSDNECASGYKCQIDTKRCIRLDSLSDINTDVYADLKIVDISIDTSIISKDITIEDKASLDNYYEEEEDILHYDSEEVSDDYIAKDEITDLGAGDVLVDSSSCQTGTLSCKDSDLYLCNENGEWILNKNCEKGCISDHCTECLKGERLCNDDTNIKICGDDGLFEFKKCDYKCYNNDCVICLPSDKYCQDKTAVTCNEIGSQWRETQCEIGCSGGDCMICEPEDQFTCNGNDLLICAKNGLEYVFYKNCCHENNCSTDKCVNTSPRVIDYNPKDWKVGNDIVFVIDGCFFVKDESVVLIDYGGSWKEITSYSNITYASREEDQIKVNVKVRTDTEYHFKVRNPDGQESDSYPIKKH